MATLPSSSDEVEYELELLPFRKYKDGRVVRFRGEDFVPPKDPDPSTGVSSRDVLIHPDTGVSARLYLPPLRYPDERLPVLIYVHGGGFVLSSPFTAYYDTYINALVSKTRVVAVSIRHRRAPEHPLPAAYDDAWGALRWVASHRKGGGPVAWLNSHTDFDRVFLAGDSSGANIAHNLAMRAGKESLPHGVTLEGVVLVHPYFWGKERLPAEAKLDPGFLGRMDAFWPFVCPSSEMGNDDPWVNPTAASLKGLGCRRVLVCVAEKDVFCGRGLRYYEGLRNSGWGGKVDVWETKGVGHVFHLYDRGCEKAAEKMGRLVDFFNGV